MGRTTSSLAVMARTLQWRLDEAAFELGGDRYTQAQRDELAAELMNLAQVLRSDGAPLIVDAGDC